jgi:GT2 family glycosyltransferase
MASESDPGHDQLQYRAEMAPLVVCVVLNWNGWRETIPCLESLAAQDYPAFQVLVVDNASTDDSVELIRAAFPAVELLQSQENGGFASGCNIGIRVALERDAAFVWLLNNDTVAPPDTVTKLVAAASSAQIGMVGTVLYYAHNPSEVQAWGGGAVIRWRGYVTHFHKPTRLGPNSYLTFASALLRSELLRETGLLDEGFFMYYEDADLCFRARANGWQFTVATDTAVLHKENGSVGLASSPGAERMLTAASLRFLGRHGRPAVLAQSLYLLMRFGRRAVRLRFTAMGPVWRGVRDWRHNQMRGFREER